MSKHNLSANQISQLLESDDSQLDLEESEYEEDGFDGEQWLKLNEDLQKDDHFEKWKAKQNEVDETISKAQQEMEETKLEMERKHQEEIERLLSMEKKRIRKIAPGIKVFSGKPYTLFNAKSLNIEHDFGSYSNRLSQLKTTYNMTKESLDAIFADPDEFVLHLSPSSVSPFIKDGNDFAVVCDFLFYSQVSTCDQITMELYKKALFDLLMNYNFNTWKLSLSKILASLQNLGGDMDLLANEKQLKTILEDRIRIIVETKGEPFSFESLCLPPFLATRVSSPIQTTFEDLKMKNYQVNQPRTKSSSPSLSLTEDDLLNEARYKSIKHTVNLVSELLSSFPARCHPLLGPQSSKDPDQTGSLVLIYLLSILSCENRLITDFNFLKDITVCYHAIFESFSTKQWEGMSDDGLPSMECSGFCDITETLFNAGQTLHDENGRLIFRLSDEQKCWDQDELPDFNRLQFLDHHHNFIHRLQHLPKTDRGRKVQRTVSYMVLQMFLDPRNIDNMIDANIVNVWDFISTRDVKLQMLGTELYLALNILRLVDMIAGNEPLQDYLSEAAENAFNKTKDKLGNLMSARRHLISDDSLIGDRACLFDFWSQMSAKWTVLLQEAKDEKYQKQFTIEDLQRYRSLNTSQEQSEEIN